MCFRVLHRDLHSMNIMIDMDLTHLTVIDVDLMCIHGGVVGVDADVNLKQHWPYQFSAWEDKLSASQDSQQLATLLVQLYTWEHLCPVNLSISSTNQNCSGVDVFCFNSNQCTGCRTQKCLGPWCDDCKPFLDYFMTLYTWPVHLQRPHARCWEFADRMVDFVRAKGGNLAVQGVFRRACEVASIANPLWEHKFKGRDGQYWFEKIEQLSSYPPPLVSDVFTHMRFHPSRSICVKWTQPRKQQLQAQAKLVLQFYLHKLSTLAVAHPVTYMSELALCDFCVCDMCGRRMLLFAGNATLPTA